MRRTDLLRKEILSVKSRIPALVALLVLLPAVFMGASLVFEDIIPRDSPVAVVPANDKVTDEEIDAVKGTVGIFGDPVEIDGMAEARRALAREEVYAVVEVPPRFAETGGTFVVHSHGAMVPYKEPSRIMVTVLDTGIDTILNVLGGNAGVRPGEIHVERNVIGEKKTLSEFLAPVLLISLVFTLGLTYIPYELRRERNAIERLRLETSLAAVVTAKILFFAALLAVPVAVFASISAYLGYEIDFLAPLSLVYLVVTFVYLAFVGSTVSIASGFSPLGRFVNVTLLFSSIVLSNIIYPVGFFSPLRRRVARLLPTHHSSVAYRSHVTKDIPATLFADRLAALLGVTLVAFVALVVVSRRYEPS